MFWIAGLVCALVGIFAIGFVTLRRAIEPACPGCRGKAWEHASTGLRCRRCGWSNLPVPTSASLAA